MTQVSYNPDHMWYVGHHKLPEMAAEHRRAHGLLGEDALHMPPRLFACELYRGTEARWMEAVYNFRSRVFVTQLSLDALGQAVKTAVLNAIRADQLSVGQLVLVEHRDEILREL